MRGLAAAGRRFLYAKNMLGYMVLLCRELPNDLVEKRAWEARSLGRSGPGAREKYAWHAEYPISPSMAADACRQGESPIARSHAQLRLETFMRHAKSYDNAKIHGSASILQNDTLFENLRRMSNAKQYVDSGYIPPGQAASCPNTSVRRAIPVLP